MLIQTPLIAGEEEKKQKDGESRGERRRDSIVREMHRDTRTADVSDKMHGCACLSLKS